MDNIALKYQKVLLSYLREIRIEAGVKQVDLAEKLNIPQSRISKYESGERRVDLLEFREICSALDLPFIECIQELEKRLELANNETNR